MHETHTYPYAQMQKRLAAFIQIGILWNKRLHIRLIRPSRRYGLLLEQQRVSAQESIVHVLSYP